MIRLAHPHFTRDDLERLWPIIESGRLVQGAAVAEFEAGCARRLGVGRVLAVNSGTAALHLALQVCEVRGGEVVVPAFGWPSAANATERLGGRVRLVDIDPETLNLDLSATQAAIGEATRAVVVIHLFGLSEARRRCEEAARGRSIIEDAACAFGGTDDAGELSGTWGRIGCFSLHARKGLASGEGGLVTAREDADSARLARLRNHGLETGPDGPQFVEPGLNYRLPEIAAALAMGQLARFEASLLRRREVAARYLERLAALSAVHLPGGLTGAGHVYQAFVVALREGVDRKRLLGALAERGIEANVGTYAVHLQPYYQARYGWRPDDFPVARWAHERLVALPMHEQLSVADVDRVCDSLDALL